MENGGDEDIEDTTGYGNIISRAKARQSRRDIMPSVFMLDRQTGCQHCQVDGRAKITIGSWCDHVIFLEGWVVRNFLLEVKVLIYIKIE